MDDNRPNKPLVPTPEVVLDATIGTGKLLLNPNAIGPSPITEKILSTEINPIEVSDQTVNLKTKPIESILESNEPSFAGPVETDTRPNPTQVVQTNSIETVKVVTVPIEIEKPVQTQAVLATSGNIPRILIGPIIPINESTLINQLESTIFTATEKEVINSVLNPEVLSSRVSNTVFEVGSSILKNAKLESASSPAGEVTPTFFPMLSKSTVFKAAANAKATNPEGAAVSDNDMVSTFFPMLRGMSVANETSTGSAEPISTKVESEVNVKLSKLADSNSVKQILTPDRTIERSVSKLTRELPESINNLSSSFTTLSPQSSNVTNITNAGTSIDQSSTVNSMQASPSKAGTTASTEKSTNPQDSVNHGEFYLQAIYAALVSGKIRVKIENT